MKKSIFILAVFLAVSSLCASAAETWRDGFVTRLMKIMTSDPSYTDVVMTDLDQNGIPEAFVIKPGMNGGIGDGITLSNNVVTTIKVPNNVIGTCLEDITVYDVDGQYIYVGKEIGRYASTIDYYELAFNGTELTCTKVKKDKYSAYKALPYKDIFSNDFLTNGYPNRTKLKAFIDSYDIPNQVVVKPSTDKVSVNGSLVDVSGFNVNYSNYYKIRDIAMVLRTTSSRFDVAWDSKRSAVSIQSGTKYTIIGGELAGTGSIDELLIEENESPILFDGEEVNLSAYNINGNNYFKVRDLGDLIGFTVGWDEATQTVLITTK